VDGNSKPDLHSLEGNLPTRGRLSVFCLSPASSAAAGSKQLRKRALAILGPRLPVRVHPPPGPGWDWPLQRCVWSGPQKVVSFVEGRSGVVGLRAQCGGPKAPASWRTPNAARLRGRHAESRRLAAAVGVIRARGGTGPSMKETGGTPSTASLGPGGTKPSNRILTVGPGWNRALQAEWLRDRWD